MANTSEHFVNPFSMDFLSLLEPEDCLKANYFGFIFYYLIMTLCFFVATPAHLWCIWFYFCSERKIKDTQLFFLNHIVMEIIYCMECGLEIITFFPVNNETLWCVLFFCFGLSWSGRPLLQTCICIEQYLAVIHPVTFLKYKGIKYRIAVAVAAWLMAFAYGVYEIYTEVFPDFIFTSVFIIALAVISFCCVSVLCALKHPGPGDAHSTKQTGKDRGNQQKRNAFNTIFSALLLILFTYLPQALLIIVYGTHVNRLLFACNIGPLMLSLNILGVIIIPLMKMYKERHQICLKHPNERNTKSRIVR